MNVGIRKLVISKERMQWNETKIDDFLSEVEKLKDKMSGVNLNLDKVYQQSKREINYGNDDYEMSRPELEENVFKYESNRDIRTAYTSEATSAGGVGEYSLKPLPPFGSNIKPGLYKLKVEPPKIHTNYYPQHSATLIDGASSIFTPEGDIKPQYKSNSTNFDSASSVGYSSVAKRPLTPIKPPEPPVTQFGKQPSVPTSNSVSLPPPSTDLIFTTIEEFLSHHAKLTPENTLSGPLPKLLLPQDVSHLYTNQQQILEDQRNIFTQEKQKVRSL